MKQEESIGQWLTKKKQLEDLLKLKDNHNQKLHAEHLQAVAAAADLKKQMKELKPLK